jgi:hypothetical protein
LVQAFLKKWWVESDFKVPNLPFHYGSKFPAVHITFRGGHGHDRMVVEVSSISEFESHSRSHLESLNEMKIK